MCESTGRGGSLDLVEGSTAVFGTGVDGSTDWVTVCANPGSVPARAAAAEGAEMTPTAAEGGVAVLADEKALDEGSKPIAEAKRGRSGEAGCVKAWAIM